MTASFIYNRRFINDNNNDPAVVCERSHTEKSRATSYEAFARCLDQGPEIEGGTSGYCQRTFWSFSDLEQT